MAEPAKHTVAAAAAAAATAPVMSGTLTLLTGVFKVQSKRSVALWPRGIKISPHNDQNKNTVVLDIAQTVVLSEERNKFTLQDRETGRKYFFLAPSCDNKDAWVRAIKHAGVAFFEARRKALAREKERMEAIAVRLGVHKVVLGQAKKLPTPPLSDEEFEAAKAKVSEAMSPDPEDTPLKQVDGKESETEEAQAQLSQEVINAANACGVDAEKVTEQQAGHDRGSGGGKIDLVDGVYWYQVRPGDTLSGVCLRLNADEARVRRVNFMSKRTIDGLKVLRIPRSMTSDPHHDYSSPGTPYVHKTEDPELRRQCKERFQIHIMVLISAQRSLKAEDCFNENEARAYLYLHDCDLNKALEAMEQDLEWDQKYGHLLRARQKQAQQQIEAAAGVVGVDDVVTARVIPDAQPAGSISTNQPVLAQAIELMEIQGVPVVS